MSGAASCAQRPEQSRGRVHPEQEHPYRSPYQRDRDRVIHSTAFRRLEYKTQVFVNHEGDHYRTRLTHTLEVAQIARTAARALGLNEDLTEAVALAHDLGHTPFGHAGEEALDEIMRTHGDMFEHNLHGLRVVDILEERYPDHRGLNLTYEVREAFVRHQTRYDQPRDLPEGFPEGEMPTLEAQLVTVADEIAYNAHDVDDGLYSSLVTEEEIRGLEIYGAAAESLVRRGVDLDGIPAIEIRRKQLVRGIIGLLVGAFLEETRRLVEESGVGSGDEVRSAGRPLAAMPLDVAEMKKELEGFLYERLYRHERVIRITDDCKGHLREMFEVYLASPEALPPDYRRRAEEEETQRVVCDYIAGMTDRFAEREHERLTAPAKAVRRQACGGEGGKA